MTPTLYIFIRRDIPDMNPGKACAQAAHAQADFDEYISTASDIGVLDTWSYWKQDRNFGRTLVVLATLAEMQDAVSQVEHASVTNDLTYPWKNYWAETFVSDEFTAAWAFPVSDLESEQLRKFPLHR